MTDHFALFEGEVMAHPLGGGEAGSRSRPSGNGERRRCRKGVELWWDGEDLWAEETDTSLQENGGDRPGVDGETVGEPGAWLGAHRAALTVESVDGAQPVEAVLRRGAVGPSRGPPVTTLSRIRRTRSWPRTVPVPPGGRAARRSPRHSAHPPSGRPPCDTGRTDGVRTSSARVTQRAREGGGRAR